MPRLRRLALLLGLGLSAAGGQGRPATTQTTLDLQQRQPVLAGQPVSLRLQIAQRGNGARVIGGLHAGQVFCPLVKVYDKAGGPPLIERSLTADCDTG
jgi:hypothetical protein